MTSQSVRHGVALGALGSVHRVGLGTDNLGGDVDWGLTPHEHLALDAIRHGLAGRRCLIDTSPQYGPDVSERLIAKSIQRGGVDAVVATKAGQRRCGDGRRVPDGSPESLRSSVQRSLRNLGVDSLDLLQLHHPDPAVPFVESVSALFGMREEGLIQEVGLCNVTADQLSTALTVGSVASVQNLLSVDALAEDAVAVLRLCELHGVAFIAARPLGGTVRHPGLVRARKRLGRSSAAQVALRLLLESSRQIVAIPGSVDVAHIRANLNAPDLPLSGAEQRAMRLALEPGLPERLEAMQAAMTVPTRLGGVPETTLEVPQQQVSDNAPLWAREALLKRTRLLPQVAVQETLLAIPGSVAFHLNAGVGAGLEDQFMAGREFLHFHPPHDGSFHAIVPQPLRDHLVGSNWAIPHLLAGYVVHPNTVMIWGPRDEDEVEICWRIIQASHSHASASSHSRRER